MTLSVGTQEWEERVLIAPNVFLSQRVFTPSSLLLHFWSLYLIFYGAGNSLHKTVLTYVWTGTVWTSVLSLHGSRPAKMWMALTMRNFKGFYNGVHGTFTCFTTPLSIQVHVSEILEVGGKKVNSCSLSPPIEWAERQPIHLSECTSPFIRVFNSNTKMLKLFFNLECWTHQRFNRSFKDLM